MMEPRCERCGSGEHARGEHAGNGRMRGEQRYRCGAGPAG